MEGLHMEYVLLGAVGVNLALTIVSFVISILAFRKAGIDWRALDQWEVETKGRLIGAGDEQYNHRLKVFDERVDEIMKIESRINGMIGRATRTARSLGLDENGESVQRLPLPSEVVQLDNPTSQNNGNSRGLKRQFDR